MLGKTVNRTISMVLMLFLLMFIVLQYTKIIQLSNAFCDASLSELVSCSNQSLKRILYDKKYISSFLEIKNKISDDRVMVSTNPHQSMYFLDKKIKVPYGINDKKSLINYMKTNGYNFLLITENISDVPELKNLFSKEGISSLNEFEEIGIFKTDFYTLHLLRLK